MISENESSKSQTVEDLINELNEKTDTSAAGGTHPIHVEHTGPDDFSAPAEPVKQETPPEPPFSLEKAKSNAVSWVKRFSTLMKSAFVPLYKWTVLAKGDIKKMEDFTRDNKGKSEQQVEDALHSDHELWPVANRFDKYMAAVKEIALTDEEINDIAEPLSELIMKYKKLQLSPEWMLAIAVFFVMLPRLQPMMPDLSKIFNSAQQKAAEE